MIIRDGTVNHLRNIDKNREVDMGNIDSFHFFDDKYYLEGDWGKLELQSKNVSIVFEGLTGSCEKC